MARFIFYALVSFLLYKLIFDFIIPIFSTTLKIKKQFNQTRQQMEEQSQQTNQQKTGAGNPSAQKNTSKVGEYIEFEEIRK